MYLQVLSSERVKFRDPGYIITRLTNVAFLLARVCHKLQFFLLILINLHSYLIYLINFYHPSVTPYFIELYSLFFRIYVRVFYILLSQSAKLRTNFYKYVFLILRYFFNTTRLYFCLKALLSLTRFPLKSSCKFWYCTTILCNFTTLLLVGL